MSESHQGSIDRREFLHKSAAATALAAGAAAGGSTVYADGPDRTQNKPVLPKRALGKTGVEVTILNQGTVGNPEALNRLLRYAYREGVRYFDTAAGYKNAESVFKDWFQAEPDVRKNIFLATKNGVKEPMDMLKKIDERLEKLGTDYIDLLFFHGLKTAQTDWPKSKEMKEAVEAVKKTGKVKFVGFSTHDPAIAEQLENAAKGGFIDVIMMKNNPWISKDEPLYKAIDACHKANIGMVSMKQFAGQWAALTKKGIPSLEKRNLTVGQGLLHAIWTDERFSSSCVTMRNINQTLENADAARRFEPLKQAELDEIRDVLLAGGPTMCPNCDGRCALAGRTKASLGDLARIYTYHEDHGIPGWAREEYAALEPHERDWSGADLAAAREACHHKIDFAKILPEVDRLMG
jgi:predicted aldo/keto reductase-like oxidoreductase